MPDSTYYANLSSSEVYELGEKKDVEGLIGVLTFNQYKEVIRLAINALGEIKDKKAVGPIIEKGLKSELISIREGAIKALGEIESDETTESLIYVMLKYQDSRITAIRALSRIKDNRAVEWLVIVMKDEDEDLDAREEAAQASAKIKGKEAVPSLISAFDSGLSERVSRLLIDMRGTVVKPLIETLNGDNEEIIWKVAAILGEIGDKRAIKPLIALLLDDSKDEWNRGYYVAAALGKIRDTAAVEPLIGLASKRSEDMITCRSVEALGDIGDDRAVGLLISILEDEKTTNFTHLRLEACRALGKIRDVRATEPLIKILENARNDTFGLVDAAAWALVQIDDDSVELPLLRYYGKALNSIRSPEASEQDGQKVILKGLSKLIARLIRKY